MAVSITPSYPSEHGYRYELGERYRFLACVLVGTLFERLVLLDIIPEIADVRQLKTAEKDVGQKDDVRRS